MPDPKTIELVEWRERAKKLNTKYKNYEALKKDCVKKIGEGYFFLTDDIEKGGVLIYARQIWEGGRDRDRIHNVRDLPGYLWQKDGSLKLIETEKMIENILPEIKKHLDVDALLRDTLQDQSHTDLIEIHERLTKPKKKASIKQKPGCVFMQIGGKPGQPFNLFLRQ